MFVPFDSEGVPDHTANVCPSPGGETSPVKSLKTRGLRVRAHAQAGGVRLPPLRKRERERETATPPGEEQLRDEGGDAEHRRRRMHAADE